jgi:hypothetical protein
VPVFGGSFIVVPARTTTWAVVVVFLIRITDRGPVQFSAVGPLHGALNVAGEKLRVVPLPVMSDVGFNVFVGKFPMTRNAGCIVTAATAGLLAAAAEAAPLATVADKLPAIAANMSNFLVFIAEFLPRQDFRGAFYAPMGRTSERRALHRRCSLNASRGASPLATSS